MRTREQFIMDLARQYNLTRQMASVLARLVRAPNVTHEVCRTLMCRLRRRLGKKITINTMFGVGYYLDEFTRARIKKAIGALYATSIDAPPTVQDGVPGVAALQIPQRTRSRDAGSSGCGCGCEAA